MLESPGLSLVMSSEIWNTSLTRDTDVVLFIMGTISKLTNRKGYSLPRRINRYKTLNRVRKALMGRLHVTLMEKWAGRIVLGLKV